MRKLLPALIIVIALLGIPSSLLAAEPVVRGDAAVLMNADGDLLWQKNGEAAMAPASLIKILNILTAWPYLDPQAQVTVGPACDSIYNGQMMEIDCGEIVEAQELLYAMLLWSANDAALALAEYLVTDLDLYAALMDKKAWALGAVHTTSVNVNGYSDPAQLTSAYDLGVIAAAFLRDETLAAMAGEKSHRLTWVYPEKEREVGNINRFLYSYAGANGLKTGTTSLAGKCLIAGARRDGRQLLAVTLNSSDRYGDCAAMLDYGFSLP